MIGGKSILYVPIRPSKSTTDEEGEFIE